VFGTTVFLGNSCFFSQKRALFWYSHVATLSIGARSLVSDLFSGTFNYNFVPFFIPLRKSTSLPDRESHQFDGFLFILKIYLFLGKFRDHTSSHGDMPKRKKKKKKIKKLFH
jgi:hypothetical protein